MNRITEELDTARETGKETGRETGYETIRETGLVTGRELFKDTKLTFASDATAAADIPDEEFEIKDFPILKWCPFCAKETATEVCYKNSSRTFYPSLSIFLAGGVLQAVPIYGNKKQPKIPPAKKMLSEV